MKIIQLTDLHLTTPEGRVISIDPLDRLNNAITHINRHHYDAKFCVISGDIADAAEPAAYNLAKQSLDNLLMPYHIMIGNHDLRKPLLDTFQSTPTSDGFINYIFEHEQYAFICLDTLKEQNDFGEFCTKREHWLENNLAKLKNGQQIILFMHHPPFDTCIPWIDKIRLKKSDRFYQIIKDYSVQYLFFGHIHRPSSGKWRNISYASCRAIGDYQVATHNDPGYDFPMTNEAPMYSVITLLNDQIHVDMQDFLNDQIQFQN